jgi:hypothetical protein
VGVAEGDGEGEGGDVDRPCPAGVIGPAEPT